MPWATPSGVTATTGLRAHQGQGSPAPICPRPMDPGRRARPQTRSAADEFYCLKSFKLLCPRSLSWPLSGYPPGGWCRADHEHCGLVVVCEWHRARAWLPVGNSTPRDSPEGYPAPLCPRPLDPGRRARPQTRSAADEFYCLKSFKLLCPRSLSWPLSGYPPGGWCRADCASRVPVLAPGLESPLAHYEIRTRGSPSFGKHGRLPRTRAR